MIQRLRLPPQWQALFSPRRLLRRQHELDDAGGGYGGREWVLARSLCRFRCFDLGTVPARDRANALRLKIRQWTPFPSSGDYVVWRGEQALVWLWDAASQQEAMTQAGIRNARILPETVLHPLPATDGPRLIQSQDGVEGQHWQDGQLLASHWWPELPTAATWRHFQRSNGGIVLTEPPAAEPVTLLARPWGRPSRFAGWLGLDARQQRLGLIAAALVWWVLVCWQLAVGWQWRQANEALAAQLEVEQAKVEPVLKLREQALAEREAALILLQLLQYPRQLELWARLAEKLPRGSPKLIEWRYAVDKLEILVNDPEADPREYVSALQTAPEFSDVSAEAGREPGQFRVRLQLKGREAAVKAKE
ncbi:MAG: hypothetical protein LAE24_04780 [Candidatus Contendobacter sp.]|nr:hypothetical protein [Candidatus Contendobacter sp.]